MSQVGRRDFIRHTINAGTLASVAGRALAANDRIRIAAIGTGSRGRLMIKQFLSSGNVEFPIVCDPDALHCRKANDDSLGGRAEMLEDYRKALDRKDIDAVLI